MKSTLLFIFLVGGFLSSLAQTYPAELITEKYLVKDFFCEEVIYPEKALNKGIEGEVELNFLVTERGEVENIRVVKSVDPEVDQEAIRVFNMLLWKPAMRLGTPVASEQTYSIKFNTKKYKKHCKSRGYDTIVWPYQPVDSSNMVFDATELDQLPYPVFDSKNKNLNIFITENIEYPSEAFDQSVSGTVIMKFIVEPHGRVSNITLYKTVGGGCSQEAIRLLKLLKWMPGIKDGTAVRSNSKMDITFNLGTESGHSLFNSNQASSH